MKTINLLRAVPCQNLDRFEKAVNRMNRRGDVVSYSIEDVFTDKDGIQFANVQINLQRQHLGNYDFVGVKKRLSDEDFLLFGDNIPQSFNKHDFSCAHCRKNIRRNEVVLLSKGDEFIQVGKSCVKEYCGADLGELENLFYLNEIAESDWETESSRGLSSDYYIEVRKWVAMCFNFISKYGYHKYSEYSQSISYKEYMYQLNKGKDVSLKDVYTDSLCFYSYFHEVEKLDLPQDYEAFAEKLLNCYLSKVAENQLTQNIQALFNAKFCKVKYSKMLTFIPTFFINQQIFEEKRKAQEAERANIVNEYAGAVGDKITTTAKILATKYLSNGFGGVTTLFIFEDKENRILKWFCSTDKYDDYAKDDIVTLKGTIKSLDEYQGRKQTNLTRCRMSK